MARYGDLNELEEIFREVIAGIAKKPEITKDMEHLIRASATVIEIIKDQPTADVVERKRGYWIRKSPTAWMWTCSCCKKDDAYAYSAGESFEPDVLQDLFCPNCGADMRGEKK